ncbi:class I adenylate-forming enzyme family protein [Arthrobacter alpinus]|uniref:class I adenylate-forming enzyme family protein n=1 Tax=Arthrobacter alpinus TaxID=656366 RepID=UPI0009F90522|nr:AMP-binding protein [Arthrobacter alpinus]
MKTMPFIDELKHWAATNGDRNAVVVGESRLTYGQLLVGAQTQPNASGTDSLAIIEVPSSTELAVAFCAAVLKGKTAMVLDAQWPQGLRAQLRQTAADWSARQMTLDGGAAAAPPFLLGLSSGTSGVPKAFVRNSASWHESFVQSVEYFHLGPESVTLAPGPMAASMNLYALSESLFAGGGFVALPHFSPDAALQALTEHNVDRLVLVPTVLGLIASRGLATRQTGQKLRSIVCAGSDLPEATLALARSWAPNADVQQYYGAAELGFVAATSMQKSDLNKDAQGVGTAFPGVQISIRDAAGEELEPGQSGDVWVKGPYACDGYAWGDDGMAFTSQTFAGSGLPAGHNAALWSTVRDQGFLDAEGRLNLSGRASDMVIVSGTNVYPHHVERVLSAALKSEPPVRGATIGTDGEAPIPRTVVVAGLPDERRGQVLVAGIYAPLTEHLPLADVRRAASSLPAAQRPQQFYQLSDLPLTGSGKISRIVLTQWIKEGDSRATRIR